jgi:hypothetical protein
MKKLFNFKDEENKEIFNAIGGLGVWIFILFIISKIINYFK